MEEAGRKVGTPLSWTTSDVYKTFRRFIVPTMTREIGKSQLVPFSRLGAANIRCWNFCPCALGERATLFYINYTFPSPKSINATCFLASWSKLIENYRIETKSGRSRPLKPTILGMWIFERKNKKPHRTSRDSTS